MNHEGAQSLLTEIPRTGEGDWELMDFATVANPLGPSPMIREQFDRMPQPSESDLRNRIGEWLSVTPKRVAIASGSTAIINAVPSLFVPEGAPCVMPVPTYFALEEPLRKNRNSVIRVPASPEDQFTASDRYIKRILDAIRANNPHLVWLCSPNNPTGTVLTQDVIATIADSTHGLVIVDEAYQEYIDPRNEQSAIRLLDAHRNILVTKTFSKAFGIPEARVGIAIGDTSVIEALQNHAGQLPSGRSITMAMLALEDQEHIMKSADFMLRESDVIHREILSLRHLSCGSHPVGGIAIIRHNTENLWQLLRNHQIDSVNLNSQEGLEGLGYVRIGLRSHETNRALLYALREIDTLQASNSIRNVRAVSAEEISAAYALMEQEFVDHGGRLRDQTLSDFRLFARESGQLWTARHDGNIIACFTLQEIRGNRGRWLYINNGVVDPGHRHQGGVHMTNLLATALEANHPEAGYIVLSTAHKIFESLRFRAVTEQQVYEIDDEIGSIAQGKIRPDDPAQIYIKVTE